MTQDELLLGDSIEIIKGFEENSIHAIISDIPYGIGCDDWDVLHANTNSALGGASAAQAKAGGLFKRRGASELRTESLADSLQSRLL